MPATDGVAAAGGGASRGCAVGGAIVVVVDTTMGGTTDDDGSGVPAGVGVAAGGVGAAVVLSTRVVGETAALVLGIGAGDVDSTAAVEGVGRAVGVGDGETGAVTEAEPRVEDSAVELRAFVVVGAFDVVGGFDVVGEFDVVGGFDVPEVVVPVVVESEVVDVPEVVVEGVVESEVVVSEVV